MSVTIPAIEDSAAIEIREFGGGVVALVQRHMCILLNSEQVKALIAALDDRPD